MNIPGVFSLDAAGSVFFPFTYYYFRAQLAWLTSAPGQGFFPWHCVCNGAGSLIGLSRLNIISFIQASIGVTMSNSPVPVGRNIFNSFFLRGTAAPPVGEKLASSSILTAPQGGVSLGKELR